MAAYIAASTDLITSGWLRFWTSILMFAMVFLLSCELTPKTENSGHEQDFHQRVANMDGVELWRQLFPDDTAKEEGCLEAKPDQRRQPKAPRRSEMPAIRRTCASTKATTKQRTSSASGFAGETFISVAGSRPASLIRALPKRSGEFHRAPSTNAEIAAAMTAKMLRDSTVKVIIVL